jgi:hypothetical protein
MAVKKKAVPSVVSAPKNAGWAKKVQVAKDARAQAQESRKGKLATFSSREAPWRDSS